jgi:hypothetical protein
MDVTPWIKGWWFERISIRIAVNDRKACGSDRSVPLEDAARTP